MSKTTANNKFSVNDRRSNEILSKIEANFQMCPTRTIDFGSRSTGFQSYKTGVRVSAVPKLTVSL